MDMEQPRRLVGYTRVSTTKQGDSGLGIEAQEAAIAAYVAATGSELIRTYSEVESGRKCDRVELDRAIAHAKRARATLVIAKLDRLSRNLHFITGLQEAKVPFVCCDNPNVNTFTIHILAAVAQEEARLTGVRTKDALAALKRRGMWSEKKQRYVTLGTNNFTREGTLRGSAAGVAVIRERKAAAYGEVAPIVLELKGQGLSLRAIAARLNEAGETTRSGRLWNPVQVKRVLNWAA